jgi:hypothetical protein
MRTDEELCALSERVLYSIEMLFASATTLLLNANGDLAPPLTATTQNAALESFVLHFRALHEFLWRSSNKRFKRDGRAADFFDDPEFWSAIRPCEEITVLAGPARVGREVAHITYGVGATEPAWMADSAR